MPRHVRGKGFEHKFDWELYPEAEAFLQKTASTFLRNNAFAAVLSKRMSKETSTRFFDWIDHIVLPENEKTRKRLLKMGFKETESGGGVSVFRHAKTEFFPALLGEMRNTEVVLKPESLEDFKRKLSIKTKIEGPKHGPYRKMLVNTQGKYILSAAERRGYNGFSTDKKIKDLKEYSKALRIFEKRKRKFSADKAGMIYTEKLVEKALGRLSSPRTADAFFRAERAYWQKRNRAGKIQKKRNDSLGLGWGNHDHHTYRSSRENFQHLIRIFEKMGYVCRERFFAGEGAGWGAQILEHPVCDIVIFADVDITKDERHDDFAHEGLRPADRLGTVGLWIGLHGESMLQAGMHHLEARFDFEKLRQDLPKYGVNVMSPFSYFPFLKQAFTQGGPWRVDKKRLDRLLRNKLITRGQMAKFLEEGAIGSHMENLQRTQGFKGFNQDSVTAVIRATDPRKQHLHRYA